MARYLSLVLLFALLSPLSAQKLVRQADLGIQASRLSQELATQSGMESAEGVVVAAVVPYGSADGMEIETNDILTGLNGQRIKNLPELQKEIQKYRAGDEVTIQLRRKGEAQEVSGMLLSMDKEKSGYGKVLYDEAAFREGYLRTITIKPDLNQERYPTVFFIPAHSCVSIDMLSPWHPYKKLIEALVEQGFAVMRVEKSGLGDCMDTPDCDTLDFAGELEAYKAGYEKLVGYDFVDTNNVFIFGHSIGGILAPILASDTVHKARGIIVYGTFIESWMEHLLRLSRFQAPKKGADYVTVARRQKDLRPLLYEMLVKDVAPTELAQRDESYPELLRKEFGWDGQNKLWGRDHAYWQSLNSLDLIDAWASTDAYVLSVFGGADLQSLDPSNHREIVKIVNRYHPGHGTYKLIPRTNHSFIEVGSMEEGAEASKNPQKMFGLYQSNFSYTFTNEIINWMRDNMDQ